MTSKSPIFTPVRIGRAGEDIALQLEAAIIEGQIQPGESLPSERDLQSQFKTGRGVIREALQALKQKGLIEIRKGARGGAFVKQMDVANASESLGLFLKQHRIDPRHLIEFRESIDRTITTLAIARAGMEEKSILLREASNFEKFLGQPDPDMAVLSEMDRQLNLRLARMTHNPIFEWIMRAVQLGYSSLDVTLYEDAAFRKETASNWRDTARAIADGDPMTALAFISYHYVLLKRCISKEPENTKRLSENPVETANRTPEDAS